MSKSNNFSFLLTTNDQFKMAISPLRYLELTSHARDGQSEYNRDIQHTLVLKVGVGQPDQISLTWRFFDRLHKHEHMAFLKGFSVQGR